MRNVVIGAGWLWGLVTLPEVTDAGMDFGVTLLLLFSGGVVGLAWIAYSAAVPGVFRRPRIRWLWLSVPGIGLGSLLLSFTHYDLVVRVWLCDSALRDYSESVRQNPKALRSSRRVGLFRVGETTADEQQVMLHTTSEFLSSSGIIYRPDGSPPGSGGGHRILYRSEHLYGPWWWFNEMRD